MANIFQTLKKDLNVVVMDLDKAAEWLGDKLKEGITEAAPVVVTILQGVKAGLDNGVVVAVEDVVDAEFHTGLAAWTTAHKSQLDGWIQDGIADALGLEVLAAGATPDQIAAFWQSASKAFLSGTAYNQSKTISDLAASLAKNIAPLIQDAKTGSATYGELITAIEATFQDFMASQNSGNSDNSDDGNGNGLVD